MKQVYKKNKFLSFARLGVLILFLLSLNLHANPFGGQIPEIPAFLPLMTDVPPTKALPIDGEWMISSIKKRIRIEKGRAYAVDPWLHMFVLKIEPLMVVQKGWTRTGPGQYAGEDLPLVGSFNATLTPNGYLNVKVAGVLGPVSYSLIPVRIDDQRRFDREKAGKNEPKEEYYSDDEDYSSSEYEGDYVDPDYSGTEDAYEGDYYEGEASEDYAYDEEYVEEEYAEEDYVEEDYAEGGEEYYEEEQPSKVKAFRLGKAKKGCKGKQIYLSGGSCYSCPDGFKRFSPTRKMTHPKACTERGLGTKKVKAKYRWEANGCPKRQFKYKGYCMSCPEGTKRMHIAGLDSGFCKVL